MTRILSLIILSALLLTQQINGEPVKDPTTSTLRQKIEYVKTRHGVKFCLLYTSDAADEMRTV